MDKPSEDNKEAFIEKLKEAEDKDEEKSSKEQEEKKEDIEKTASLVG